MSKASLLALAERIEAACEPDRELDAAIVMALYPDAQVTTYIAGDDEPSVFHAEPLVRSKHALPEFTASVDAALTLTTGLDKRIGGGAGLVREAIDRISHHFSLHISFWPDKDAYPEWLARYITAASLRARASMEEA